MQGKSAAALAAILIAAAPAGAQAPAAAAGDEVVVTATRRASPLQDVPIAVTAITGAQMAQSGASDLRQLNQLVPSLLVSSTSSEAGGGAARIRGIGTVGDNAGLESSVATFVDGVYRSRSAVALTELGPIDRVEVLRGPQGTLFGRNASAGLINIVTAGPSFTQGGYGEASVGNYAYRRLGAGLTGPISSDLAYRLDGVWTKRRGFIEEVISGRHINDRDRWLARGKLLYKPSDRLSLLLSADYSRRNEECCIGPYLTVADVTSSTPGVAGGQLVTGPSSIAALLRGITSTVPGAGNGRIIDDTYARQVALTPGRSFRQDVTDWGGSAEVNAGIGAARLTSITAYRGNRFIKGQDADFGNLDLIVRPSDGSGFIRFRTFTQELRLQGTAFAGRLDWLVGGYFADERLTFQENLSYGQDFERFAGARIAGAIPALAAFPSFGFRNLHFFAQAFAAAQPALATLPVESRAAVVDQIGRQVLNVTLDGTGSRNRFNQHDRNFALFTHDILALTDRLSLTIGARYTDDRKRLDANYSSTSGCGTYAANIGYLRGLAATTRDPVTAQIATALAGPLAAFTGLACVVNSTNGRFAARRHEGEWSGTAVLSYKPTPATLAYASFARGYKAGGFNLDAAPLFNSSTLQSAPFSSLGFDPERVDAWEVGAKYGRGAISLSAALFYQTFRDFQLNTFNGLTFFVSNIEGCKDALGSTDSDAIVGNSPCTRPRSGVTAKGIELEGSVRPLRDVTLTGGMTYADTRYRDDLIGSPDPLTGNVSLQPTLFRLPGSRLSNAPRWSATASAGWTPPVGAALRGLVYADLRYTGRIDTGSDLFVEKRQPGFVVANARIGLGRADGRWTIELWAQNLFDAEYKQIGFNQPLQGGGVGAVPGTATAVCAFGTSSTQLFGAFLGEPRTWGLTVRSRF